MADVNTQIAETYQPVLKNLEQQSTLAGDRYAQNKADIVDIFGKLTSLSAADSARINDQYTKTIADQQLGLAQRTAEVRSQQQSYAEGSAQTGAQRGNGPVGSGPNQVDMAAERSIGRSNEYQTTWEALMNANKMQAQQNASDQTASYGQQQATALTALQRDLETRLLQIGSNTASVQSDIAKAQLAAQQDAANAQARAQADAAQQNATLTAAQIRAQAQISAADIAAKSRAENKTYSNTPTGWAEKTAAAQLDPAAIAAQTQKWIKKFSDPKNLKTATGVPRVLNQALLKDVWYKTYGGQYPEMMPYVEEYIQYYSGLSK